MKKAPKSEDIEKAIFFYGIYFVRLLKKLDISEKDLRDILLECDEISARYPIHIPDINKKFKIKAFEKIIGFEKELTPLQVLALFIVSFYIFIDKFFPDNEIKEHNKDILFSTFLVLKDIIKAEEIFEKE